MTALFNALTDLVLVLVSIVSNSAELDKRTKLYLGTQDNVNAGVVTTSQSYLNGTTKEIGYTVDDASAEPVRDFIEVFTGTAANKNAGVVSISQNHMYGSMESIGYLSKKAVRGGTKLYVGTQANCNAGVVTNSVGHLNCSTEFVGYALPR